MTHQLQLLKQCRTAVCFKSLQAAIVGKWKITGVAEPIDLQVSGSSVTSVQKPFGNEPLMAEIEASWQRRSYRVRGRRARQPIEVDIPAIDIVYCRFWGA